MSRRTITMLTTAVLSACAVHGRADEKPARAPAQTGAIAGLVVDQQGRPVAGAAVWGDSRAKVLGQTRSGALGRFRLSRLEADAPVTVKLAEPWQGAVVVTVEAGKTARGVVVDFRPPGPLVEPAKKAAKTAP